MEDRGGAVAYRARDGFGGGTTTVVLRPRKRALPARDPCGKTVRRPVQTLEPHASVGVPIQATTATPRARMPFPQPTRQRQPPPTASHGQNPPVPADETKLAVRAAGLGFGLVLAVAWMGVLGALAVWLLSRHALELILGALLVWVALVVGSPMLRSRRRR